MSRFRALSILALAVLALIPLACTHTEDILPSGPTSGNPVLSLPVTPPIVQLVSAIPPHGETLHAQGRVLSFEARFSFEPQSYPLAAAIWVVPEKGDWRDFGDARGCRSVAFLKYASVNTIACDIYLDPLVVDGWRKNGFGSVALVFVAFPYDGKSSWTFYQDLPLKYRLP